MVGGAPVTQEYADAVGADGYAPDASATVEARQGTAARRSGALVPRMTASHAELARDHAALGHRRGGDRPRPPFCLIGERINPTGRRIFQEQLRAGDLSAIERDVIAQVEGGADVLDVNMGVPLTDEPELLAKAIRLVQELTDKPICIEHHVERGERRAATRGGDEPAHVSVDRVGHLRHSTRAVRRRRSARRRRGSRGAPPPRPPRSRRAACGRPARTASRRCRRTGCGSPRSSPRRAPVPAQAPASPGVGSTPSECARRRRRG